MNEPTLIGSCARKRRYSTEAVARSVAAQATQARGDPLRVYWCALCGGYHLSKVRPGDLLPEPAPAPLPRPAPPKPKRTADEIAAAERAQNAAWVAAQKAKTKDERRAEGIRQAAELLQRNGWLVVPPEDEQESGEST